MVRGGVRYDCQSVNMLAVSLLMIIGPHCLGAAAQAISTPAPDSTSSSPAASPPDARIFGMSMNVAILVFAVAAFVVIGLLLFVLHRQCKYFNAKHRMLAQALASRRDGDDTTDAGTERTYAAPSQALVEVMPLMHSNPQQQCDSDEEGELRSPEVVTSARKVSVWLTAEAELPPPQGTLLFSALSRPTSFATWSTTDFPASSASGVYARGARNNSGGNSFQRRRHTLPSVMVPLSHATFGAPHEANPFADIPVVAEVSETHSHSHREGISASSPCSATSDPFV